MSTSAPPWGFPLPPYPCQADLVVALQAGLDHGGMTILESPTGTVRVSALPAFLHVIVTSTWTDVATTAHMPILTPHPQGKTLSLICGVLDWLSRHAVKPAAELAAAAPAAQAAPPPKPTEPAWMSEFDEAQHSASAAAVAAHESDALHAWEAQRQNWRADHAAIQAALTAGQGRPALAGQKRGAPLTARTGDAIDALFAGHGAKAGQTAAARRGSSAPPPAGGATIDASNIGAAQAAIDAMRAAEARAAGGAAAGAGDTPASAMRRVIFASRTHSQLSQFVQELRRTPWAAKFTVVAASGRSRLCVHPRVSKLGSDAAMADACADLLQRATNSTGSAPRSAPALESAGSDDEDSAGAGGTASGCASSGGGCTTGCPYLQPARQAAIESLLLAAPSDVERAARYGQVLDTCGYFGSRRALKHAQVIVAPYGLILSQAHRQALGIDLSQSIIVFDEAHNIVDAVCEAHGASISGAALAAATKQLRQWAQRYGSRMSAANRSALKQVMQLLMGCATLVLQPGAEVKAAAAAATAGSAAKPQASASSLISVPELMLRANCEHLRLHELSAWLRASGLARKIRGHALRAAAQAGTAATQPAAMFAVHAFIDALCSGGDNGQVLLQQVSTAGRSAGLKFVTLAPWAHFKSVVQQAHAVVMAGGTMAPTADVKQALVPHLAPNAVREFTCGHVVPAEAAACAIVSTTVTGQRLRFTFSERRDPALLNGLAATLQAAAEITPGGVAVFFPSHDYLATVQAAWRQSGAWAKLAAVKPIHVETRGGGQAGSIATGAGSGSAAPDAWAAFQASVQSQPERGAILLCVIGGKLSEGINFADQLARLVAIVGVPYANPTEPVLAARMAALDASCGPGAGRAWYTDSTMKAVNQAVGRALRHAKDWAAVWLLDERYAEAALTSRLAAWCTRNLQRTAGAGAVAQLRAFVTRRTGQEPQANSSR